MRKHGLRLAGLALAAACIPACGGGGSDSSSSSSDTAAVAQALLYPFYLLFGFMSKADAGGSDLDSVLPEVTLSAVAGETGSAGETIARVEGTAWDDVLVLEVAWINETTGETGRADGTATWTAGIPLAEGENLVSVGVRDWASNMNLVSFVLERSGDSVIRRD